ncbi:hypothetical protein GKZ90_0016630 [Flavobacterium sp. MC2016-06]|uniref:alginate O-acetyltransferase AlgX-related protein n=1 Tax=Flavobacterium sp. MC2016-06 TaxID=2676308 RepID=UPI0018ACE514|nr:hypothetical protein [Flavobacterium sp. MC2016-06]MBU3860002.1 hypothetical protein [Flavobacterium sp. MC2016-06]
MGYFPNFIRENRSVFNNEFKRNIYFYKVSRIKNKKAKILTIGDSFSEQGNFGYKNYLAENYEVLHVDRFISENQIETLYGLLNGDFFEKNNVEYVLLENVERNFVYNVQDINISKKIMISQLDNLINDHKRLPIKENQKDKFFSSKTINFPLSMFRYYYENNYLSNEIVYNVTLKTNKLFSNNSNKLLFFHEDLECLKFNNDFIAVQKLNDVLNDLSNKLKHKKMKLIVLPAPDKYDLYYDYIADKKHFSEPLFFKYLAPLKKDYIYIDSKKNLSAQLKNKRDVYFFDDTHWSPVASKIISEEIKKVITDK